LRGAKPTNALRRRLIGGFERPEPSPYPRVPGPKEPRGARHACPRSVRNPAKCPPPPPSNGPVTSCSRTSCAAACWKPPPSTRRNGSTTRCCTSPSATMRWTSSGWRSCACWASATADRWWRGAPPWARAPERRRLERTSGRPLSRAPFFLVRPPGGEAPEATPHREPHPAAQSELRVPPPPAARPLVDAEQRRQIARAPRPSRADERQPQPPVRPDAAALARAEHGLPGRRQADAHRHLEATQRDALLLEDQHDVRRGARGRGDQQHLDRRRGDRAVAIHQDGRPTGRAGLEQQPLAPSHGDLATVARHLNSLAALSAPRIIGCDGSHSCRGTRAAS